MKKSFVFIAAAVIFAGLFSSCKKPTPQQNNPPQQSLPTQKVTLSFISSDTSQRLIEKEQRDIVVDHTMIELRVLREIMKGPQNTERATNVLPEGMDIDRVSRFGGTVIVILKYEGEPSELEDFLLIKASIALTLFDLPGIEEVGVYINSDERDESGSLVGLMSKSSLLFDSMITNMTEEVAVLYFPKSSLDSLGSEIRTINLTTGSICSKLVEELMRGPKSPSLVSLFNPDTKLVSTFITDGICYINLSGDLFDPTISDEEKMLAIYSIVNTITTQSDIKAVQFLIVGKTSDELLAFTDYKVFVKNMDLMPQ